MAIDRRVFLTSALSGAGVVALASCTSEPAPAPSSAVPTATTTPTPKPTASDTPMTASGIAPRAFRRSAWGKDPYSYGSASYLTADSTDTDRATLRAPLNDRLFLAGEATASTTPGTVMGARASGFEVAEAVAAAATKGERIAVVGAGMTGATAARTLADLGFDVVVVEARGRIGGRIASVSSGDWPFEIQLGVGALTGDGSPALAAALAMDGAVTVPFAPREASRTVTEPTTPPDSTAVETALADAFAWSEKQSGELTVDEALTGSGSRARLSTSPDATGVSDTDRLAFVLAEGYPARFGAAPDALSARAEPAALVPTDAALVTKGFASFVSHQLRGLDVLRSSNVTRISYANEGVGLRLATGESLSADRVVLTVPLGVLKKKRIEFAPELPASYTAAIEALGMGVQDVLWLRFDERLWSTDATVWTVQSDTAAFPLWLNLEPATGSPVLVALTGGDTARAAEKLSDTEAVRAALASIAGYLDVVPSTASPTPSESPTPTP